MPRVFVTGIGIISAIGSDTEEVLHALENRQTGIGRLSLFNSVHQNDLPVGEIKLSNSALEQKAGFSRLYGYSRTALLGIIAARQAVRHANLTEKELAGTAVISGTTTGGMDRSEVFFNDFMQNSAKGRLRDVAGHDCGDSTEKIADILGVRGYFSTINTACSSSANAIMLGARMIQQGRVERVIAGGTDALTRFTLNGFNSLMILDHVQCKPFDENRNGLNLGEGSGFLVLESEELVNRGHKPVLGEIAGYGNACDAYHQTASSPEGKGAYMAMKQALEVAIIDASAVSYINTHGTGTRNNDLSEGIAIERLFQPKIPPCSSTKSFTGHTLGAAGAIEAVISILALQHQCIFPNLNFTEQMHELGYQPVKDLVTHMPLKYVMSNSFGFGGNNSSLIFSVV